MRDAVAWPGHRLVEARKPVSVCRFALAGHEWEEKERGGNQLFVCEWMNIVEREKW